MVSAYLSWDDVWLIEQPLAVACPELHAMVQQTEITVPSVLSGQGILKIMVAMGQINASRVDQRIEGPSFLSVSSCSFFLWSTCGCLLVFTVIPKLL